MSRNDYEVKETFVRIMQRVPGVLYEPVGLERERRTAVLVMHSDEDYLTCPTGPELAKRGYRVLCANVMSKEGAFYSQIEKMKAVKGCMEFLQKQESVGSIVLMGHSGGATLLSAYQAIAENGASVFQGKDMILQYPDNMELPAADGIMLFDANWGNAVMQLFSLDPAVVDERMGVALDPEYNLFEPDNGFDPEGSHFSEEFIKKFLKKQGERNNAILAYAQGRLKAIREGKGDFSDDEPLVIPGADQAFFNNKLYAQDIRLMSHTKYPHALLHPDDSITEEIVYSLRGPENPKSMTHSLVRGARIMTVYNYLSSYAVRTLPDYGYGEDMVWGIDWDSTYSSPVGNVKHIEVPSLFVGMTAGWEYLASETIYEYSAAKEKQLAFVEGANHKFYPEKSRESYPGQFGDTMKTLHDYAAEWLETHF